MIVYKLRDRLTGKFINKNRRSTDRIYQHKRHAAAAASLMVESDWRRVNDESWWSLSREERRAFRERMIEIVEFDCVEVKE